MTASSRMSSSFDAILTDDIELLLIDLLAGKASEEKEMLPIVTYLHNWFVESIIIGSGLWFMIASLISIAGGSRQ
jgi:hypothetical protein